MPREKEKDTQPQSGKFKITNVGGGPRIVPDSEGKMHPVPVGGSIVIFVGERQERDLRNTRGVMIEETDDEPGKHRFTDQEALVPVKTPEELKTEEDATTAAELLDKSDEISYPELLRQSREVLGGDFPTGAAGGQPRKKALVDALRRRAKKDEAAE